MRNGCTSIGRGRIVNQKYQHREGLFDIKSVSRKLDSLKSMESLKMADVGCDSRATNLLHLLSEKNSVYTIVKAKSCDEKKCRKLSYVKDLRWLGISS